MSKDHGKPVAQEEAELQGRLEYLQRTKHPRSIIEALDAGWLPQGTRLVETSNPEEGRVLAFTKEEAALLVDPLRKIAQARIEDAGK